MQRRSLLKTLLLSPLISILPAESEADRQMRDNYNMRPMPYKGSPERDALLEQHARDIEHAIFFGAPK